ncbi:hypothetical protein Nmel_005945, partial [Mimus melanotis]
SVCKACIGLFLRGNVSEVDYEKLAEVEQQKDEMDDTHSEIEETFLHPPPEDPELNINHPYHDVMTILEGRYLKYILDQYVENDYTVIYFHYGLKSLNKMSLKWLQTAYQEFDRKYKKNLKALCVVHPTNFIKILWNIFKPLISHKFGKKITCFNYLDDLGNISDIPQEEC